MIDILDISIRAEDSGRLIVPGFTLRVKKGGRAVLTGPSGSGKTTVLRAVMGFVLSERGEVLVDGLRLDGRTVWQARRLMGYVPQELDMGGGTVRDVLIRPFRYRAAHSMAWDEAEARRLFSLFRLAEGLLKEDSSKLSGGEKKRVALVSALLLRRPILVLDETTSALDPASRAGVVEYLRGRKDLTILAASHDEALQSLADEVVSLPPVAEGAAR